MVETAQSAGVLRVVDTRRITPKMLRLTTTIDTPHLPIDPACPNQVLRLSPPTAPAPGGGRAPSRTYTIRYYDDATGLLDIDVVLHGDGPFVRWATAAAPGDTIRFTGPRPHAVPSYTTGTLIMASDETGLPAVAALLEAAPAGHCVIAVIEVADAAEEQQLTTDAKITLRWLHRNGAPAGTTGALERAVRALDWPDAGAEFWVAGETTEVRVLRRFAATERGVPRTDVHAYGYWRRGRAGSPD